MLNVYTLLLVDASRFLKNSKHIYTDTSLPIGCVDKNKFDTDLNDTSTHASIDRPCYTYLDYSLCSPSTLIIPAYGSHTLSSPTPSYCLHNGTVEYQPFINSTNKYSRYGFINKQIRSHQLLPSRGIHIIRFLYTSGLFLKVNGRVSVWCKYLNRIVSTDDIRSSAGTDLINSLSMLFFLNYVSLSRSLSSIRSLSCIKLTPVVLFRFANFFSFNIMGDVFNRLGSLFYGFSDNDVFFVIKVNRLYNSSGIWGKKRKIKKAKSKVYYAKTRSDSLYRDGSLFN